MASHELPGTELAKFQFNLNHLLLVVTALCVLFAMAASWEIAGVFLFCFLAGIGLGSYYRSGTLVGATLALGAWAFCLVPGFQTSCGRSPRVYCQSNLRQIALAMHQYNDAYGTLPPAYLADTNGKPMHSWRVLLLPFLDEQALYDQYDFSEPWDGPNNSRLAGRIPEIFVCPEDPRRGAFDTSYVVVTGSQTPFNGSRAMSLDQLAAMDGVSATVLVVECAASGINWMQPRDLQYDQMSFTLNDWSAKQSVRSGHAQGANVAMADAAAKRITRRVDPRAWQGAFTADGGEPRIEF